MSVTITTPVDPLGLLYGPYGPLGSLGSTVTTLPTPTITTTITPDLRASVLAMNTSYSNALHLANTAPFLYYSNLYNTPSQKNNFYNDLNDDKDVQKTVTKYFYYKIVDKWLLDDLLPLLAFVEIVDGEPRLIKSLDEFNIEKLGKESESDTRKKAKYMEHKIISKDLVRHVLKKVCSENNINWYGLNKHNNKIKKILFKYLSDKIKSAIKNH